MNIPKAIWHEYPPSIEFESTDLPLEVVKELAGIALNRVNVRIRRDDVMNIVASEAGLNNRYTFHIAPDTPATQVHGPEVVEYHNTQIEPTHRHAGLIEQARRQAKLARQDEKGV